MRAPHRLLSALVTFFTLTACRDLGPRASPSVQPETAAAAEAATAPTFVAAPRLHLAPTPSAAVAASATPASVLEPASDVRKPTAWAGDDSVPGARRAEAALANRKVVVERLFEDAGVQFPPAQVFLRVFKAEGELEAWASSEKGGRMERIATYKVCKMSGDIGPKRREGDLQVPEGFYRIEYFWPDSAFYLAGKVSYPNGLDKQLGGASPGGDIMLHGGCASIGCISMSDERMEELYVMGTSVYFQGEPVAIHIFPTREIHELIASGEHPEHRDFWANLAEGLDAFEKDKRVPNVRVGWKGRYELADG